jgi:hypothetical protein
MDVFSFEDAEEGCRLGQLLPPSSSCPRPGPLFGSSPRPVASGMTRGEKKEEPRVRLLHVKDPEEQACGGVIGDAENRKFCAAHPSLCEHQLSHLGKNFQLGTDSLCVMSAKKGGVHAVLCPEPSRNCVPDNNKDLEELLDDARPASVWHVFFGECNAAEDAAGENELGTSSDISWEAVERPSLENLERANDFKTPKKV